MSCNIACRLLPPFIRDFPVDNQLVINKVMERREKKEKEKEKGNECSYLSAFQAIAGSQYKIGIPLFQSRRPIAGHDRKSL